MPLAVVEPVELVELAVESSLAPVDVEVDASPPLDVEVVPGGTVVTLVLKPDPWPLPPLQAAASARVVSARRRMSPAG